jgi:hypothetical protein
MGSFKERRQLARFRVRWPMLYANEELIGQGTLRARYPCEPVSCGLPGRRNDARCRRHATEGMGLSRT